jgi:methionine sulfoxide reductase heme-binding subunit
LKVSKSVTSVVGLVLFAAYILQYSLSLNWTWLNSLQQNEMYKRWSGLVLAIFILFQWLLSFTRIMPKLRPYNLKMTNWHKWLGAISPILFYMHSAHLGFGYLLLLSYLFLINTLIGYINLDFVKTNSEILFKLWMIFHVTFSVIITFLMFFHIGIVFYYK